MKILCSLFGNLKAMLVGVSLVSAIVPAAVLGVGSALEIRDLTVERRLDQNRLLAESFADNLDDFLDSRSRSLQALADRIGAAGTFDNATVRPILVRQLERFPRISRLVLADARGFGIANVPPGPDGTEVTGLDYSDRRYFKDVVQKRVTVVDPEVLFGKTDGAPVVAMAAPVLDSTGTLRGVAIAAVGIGEFREIAERFRQGSKRGARIQIATSAGTVVMRSDADAATALSNASISPIWSLIAAKETGTVDTYLGTDGVRRMAGFATIQSVGWKIWIGQPLSEIDASILAAYRATAGWVAAAAAAAVALSLVLSFLIARPIQTLRATAATIAAGDLGRRAAEGGPRELADLAKSFNGMAESLERKIAEEHSAKLAIVAANGKLDAANKELETFSYSVSHDLRTPLRAIDGFSRILMEDYAGKLDAEGQRLLTVVRESTQKMGRLIDDILAFSRAGRQALTLGDIDMDALARDSLKELEPAVGNRGVTFDIRPLPRAHGDAATLRRVWINLIDNAIKFTAPKPAATIEIGTMPGEKETIYYIKDNGVGFDMQYAEKLFGVFQRLHGPAEFPGTGIGLAIVKRIVSRHGGRVWAEGKVGEGATFGFALPKKERSDG